MEDELCVLPADGDGRVLDRLAALEQVIDGEAVRQALRVNPTPYRERRCVLTREVMLWVVLAMGILTHLPIRQVFKAARRLRRGEPSPPPPTLSLPLPPRALPPVPPFFQRPFPSPPRPQHPAPSYTRCPLLPP